MQITDVLVLQSLKGVGNRTLVKIIEFYRANNLKAVHDIDFTKVPKLNGSIAQAAADLFSGGEYDVLSLNFEKMLSTWRDAGINVLAYGSSDYPAQLNLLLDPPALLFYKGDFDLLKNPKSIAVVGTRNNTRLGEKIAYKTVEHFSSEGFCIVSGLALGIDAIAHRAALDHQGRTVAVLVDLISIAPSNHQDLAEQILRQGGVLVSENPPGTKVIPALFAKRDRIQAGLAMAVFAIETAIDGGTMHAVKAASSMRRKVFVPNASAAGYPDLGIEQISGTQELVHSGVATSYTRDTYAEISQALTVAASSFADTPRGTGSFL
ncbi:DNA-processing protein DprA [Pseudomonas sp. Marseille-Q5115]|uniref:DNA-processing protein DprA n=1 Tax=Pseudomonas sp. Marseille-Q5115 TaxID=2866593 RepID=UPI001CE481DF|nr:DNA-processing protein DprA [Pseudomonas sp. Marseille-Q5115]